MNTLKRLSTYLLVLLLVFAAWWFIDPQLVTTDEHAMVYSTYFGAVILTWVIRRPIRNKETSKEKVIIFDRGRKQPVDVTQVVFLIILSIVAIAGFIIIANNA